MRKLVWALCLTAFVLAIFMGCGGGSGGSGSSGTTTFSQADLSGNWGFHVLGTNPTDNAWGHGIFSIDATGNGVVTTQTWSDSSYFENTTFTLSGDGVMSLEGTTVHGFMSGDKNTVVATFTNGAGGSSFWLLQRVGTTTFSQADLSGNWGFHLLGVTSAGSTWGHGIFSIDATGNGIVTTQAWSDSSNFDNTTFTLSSDGVMSAGGTVHGFMSGDKNTVAATFTNGAGGSSFWLLQRVGTTTFSQADLSGNWGCHLFGVTPTGSAWGYGMFSIDATGNGVVTTETWSDSSYFSNTTFTLSSDGVMSAGGTVHGFMSGEKNTVVATFTNGAGGSSFWLLQKK